MKYKDILEWLIFHEKLGYWIIFFTISFIILLIIYLFMCNIRLHFHIRAINRDKERLMQEKDLMRQGLATATEKTPEPEKTEEPKKEEQND